MMYVNSSNQFWIALRKLAGPDDGNTVKAYYKVDAEDEWMELGEVELNLTAGGSVQIGRAVTSGSGGNSQVTMESSSYAVNVNGGSSRRRDLATMESSSDMTLEIAGAIHLRGSK
jgi:hypothetical protein